ncbi:MAG: tRNA (adenosine(37)-N6)-dimethylallyltransferase [Bacilli bacterium]
MDKNNRIRMIRFLNKKNIELVEPKLLYKNVIFIGLTTSRDKLYEVINKRVDKMFNDGLIDEVRRLYNKNKNSKILNRAIGYKEVIKYLEQEIDLEEAKELIKKNSRHYAKRQYTWFNNKMNIKWFNVNYDNFLETINEIKRYINGCNK